jgi:hypothetical protein
VDEVRELHWIADEEHRRVVADHVVVAFFGIELECEATNVAIGVCVSFLSCHGGKARQHWCAFSDLAEEVRLGPLGDVVGHLEVAKRAASLDVVHAIGDALANEVGKLLDEVDVVQ